ncbi:MAG: outer membrane beta-barrel protein [Proteobacteria bacterium]|nr:outer membrane beta-barrel protein [Pseudomonadota bacterium]
MKSTFTYQSVYRQAITVALGILVISESALARRSSREGLNFGTSLRIMDADDRTNQTSSNDQTSRTQSAGQAFTPHIGYSFGDLNFGLVGNIENKSQKIEEKKPTTNEEVNRNSQIATKAVSLFGRFNFGKVMYMETGAGLYSQVTDTHIEYKLAGESGSFSGRSEDFKTSGVGPGYHIGGGIELAIDNGFYFTGSYIVRSFSLRDQSKSEFGEKVGSQQQRELNFGISYYN